MIVNVLKDKMPPLPNYVAQYRVIYLEPINGSNERYTIGVMAKSPEESVVLQTIAHQTLRCMFGNTVYKNVKGLVDLALSDAKAYLEQGGSIEEWKPPFEGLFLGETRTSFSSNKMKGILFQAVSSFSSLYKGEIVDEPIRALSDEQSQEDEIHSQRFITSIKQNLSDRYKKNFSKRISLDQGMTVTIDYAGKFYNAALLNFNVQNPSQALKTAKVKLLELESYRDSLSNNRLFDDNKFEILIADNHESNSNLKDDIEDAIRQFQGFSNQREIESSRWNAIPEIALHIKENDPLILNDT